MVCASSTTARPPMAAKAASLALSIRRGLPPAVMYRKPAQAKNSAAAAMPTFVAASSSVLNNWMMVSGLVIECPFELEYGVVASRVAYPAGARVMGTPEAAENGLDRDRKSTRLNSSHIP